MFLTLFSSPVSFCFPSALPSSSFVSLLLVPHQPYQPHGREEGIQVAGAPGRHRVRRLAQHQLCYRYVLLSAPCASRLGVMLVWTGPIERLSPCFPSSLRFPSVGVSRSLCLWRCRSATCVLEMAILMPGFHTQCAPQGPGCCFVWESTAPFFQFDGRGRHPSLASSFPLSCLFLFWFPSCCQAARMRFYSGRTATLRRFARSVAREEGPEEKKHACSLLRTLLQLDRLF